MTLEEMQLAIIKNIIDKTDSDTREKIYECANVLRNAITECGEWGKMALALVGAEAVAEVE